VGSRCLPCLGLLKRRGNCKCPCASLRCDLSPFPCRCGAASTVGRAGSAPAPALYCLCLVVDTRTVWSSAAVSSRSPGPGDSVRQKNVAPGHLGAVTVLGVSTSLIFHSSRLDLLIQSTCCRCRTFIVRRTTVTPPSIWRPCCLKTPERS
jgi:hypothetical protein